MTKYETAQICLNGHIITDETGKGQSKNFCTDCGEPTIVTCPNEGCNKPILGARIEYDPLYGASRIGLYTPPHFCHGCGSPYPLTVSVLKAAEELILLEESVEISIKENVIDTLPDLLEDTPRTQIGIARLNLFL